MYVMVRIVICIRLFRFRIDSIFSEPVIEFLSYFILLKISKLLYYPSQVF